MTEKFKLLIVLFCVALLFGGMFVTYNYFLDSNTDDKVTMVEEASNDKVVPETSLVKKVNKNSDIKQILHGSHILKMGTYNRQLIINSVDEGSGEYHFTYSIPALGKKHSKKTGLLNTNLKTIKLESLGEGTYKHNDDKYFFTSINNSWNFKI